MVPASVRDNCTALVTMVSSTVLRSSVGLVEQAHVLDSNHGLVGEGLQQFDVANRKRTGFIAGDDDRADRRASAQHRHREDAPPIAGVRDFLAVGWISERVLDLGYRPSENRAARGLVGLRRSWMRPIEGLQHLGRAVVVGYQFHQLTI